MAGRECVVRRARDKFRCRVPIGASEESKFDESPPPPDMQIIPQFLHWMTVILVIIAWTLGTFGDELPKGDPRATGLFIHVAAGLL